MSKTLVCIISEDSIVNYLFIKELFKRGDSLLLIAEQDYEEELRRVAPLFGVAASHINRVVLRKEYDDESWGVMCHAIRNVLREDVEYVVNLAGGSRLMALAVQQVFEAYKSKFYYIPETRNLVIHSLIDNLDNNDDVFTPMTYRISVVEYLKLYGLSPKAGRLMKSEEYTRKFFNQFVNQDFTTKEYNMINNLREYRNRKTLHIDTVENKRDEVSAPNVNGLSAFLNKIEFQLSKEGTLNGNEIQYLTGGWFEEYVYHKIKRDLQPDSIAIGVFIQRKNTEFPNELDVVFTLGNKLFVIECKTGVQKAALFHQIAYKACALHESMLGVSSFPYIFSLSRDYHDNMTVMARNLDIYYCDREYFLRDTEWQRFVADVKDKAFG